MSFILDALKKSEIDRQQQGGAEFAALPVSPRVASVPRWLWIVGLLLAVNLVVLVGLLLRADPPPMPASLPAVEQTRPTPIAESAPQPSFEQQVAAARKRLPEPSPAVDVPRANAGDKVPDVGSAAVQAVLISQNPSAVPASDRYPSLQEVRASGKIQLPDLHLDIHVYSAAPRDRFVFINMAKLREGSRLDEGPVVVEITPDGVVLEHQGQHFLLPRE
jgi:general secretion pathway protein B